MIFMNMKKLEKELHKINKGFSIQYKGIIDPIIEGRNLGLTEIPEILTILKTARIDLSNNKIKKMKNFKSDNVILLTNNSIEDISELNQKGQIYLNGNNIREIHNFKQNFHLNLDSNKIEVIDGFFQNDTLSLNANHIKIIKNFHHNDSIILNRNAHNIAIENFNFNDKHRFSFDKKFRIYDNQIQDLNFLDKNNIKYELIQNKYKGVL